MKEFTVCYTCENNIITEKIIKKEDVKKEDVEKEVMEKMNHNQSFNVKTDQGNLMINTYSVRYVRVIKETILV
jgi:hypothetical protein